MKTNKNDYLQQLAKIIFSLVFLFIANGGQAQIKTLRNAKDQFERFKKKKSFLNSRILVLQILLSNRS
jgi:hypothetical protein